MGSLWVVIGLVACSIVSFNSSNCCEPSIFHISDSGNDSIDCLDRYDNDSIPCATLQYFIANTMLHNCILVNIMSDQILADLVLTIQLFHDSVFIGSNVVSSEPITIHCDASSGILVRTSNRLSFESLYFKSCSLNISASYSVFPDFTPRFTSIMINLCDDVKFRNCSFYNYSESAIFIRASNTSIQYSTFMGVVSHTSAIVFWESYYQYNFHIQIIGSTFIANENVVPHDCADSVLALKQGLGGAIQLNSSIISLLIEDSSFKYNTATVGGAVGVLYSSSAHVDIRNTEFIANKAVCQGGAVAFAINRNESSSFLGDLTLDNCRFYGNSANKGGAVAFIYDEINNKNALSGSASLGNLTLKSSNFLDNRAYEGGALLVTVESCSDCIDVVDVVSHNNHWDFNWATRSGFAIALKAPQVGDRQAIDGFPLQVSFFGQNRLADNGGNETNSFGAVVTENVLLKFNNGSDTLLDSTIGTSIVLHNSVVHFDGKVLFKSNSGNLGGAILIDGKSEVLFGPVCNVSFINNSASALGGAIYSEASQLCPFEVGEMTNNSSVFFESNAASLSNQSIYLETIGKCDVKDGTLSFLEKFVFADSSETIILPLEDASIAIESLYRKITLGEKFFLRPSALTNALGQTASGIGFIAFSLKKNYQLIGPGKIHLDLNFTNKIEYFIRGPEVLTDTELSISVSYEKWTLEEIRSYSWKTVKINFIVEPCRQGQVFDEEDLLCNCLEGDNLGCSQSGQNLCVKRHHWYDFDSEQAFPCPSLNCIYSTQSCPNKTEECSLKNYCMIENSDDVCQEGRSGFLCSKCKENYYFTFAAVHCVPKCSKLYTLWLVLALLGYWVILLLSIVLVLSLKLSVGSGFMYGLVYFFSVATIFTSSSELYNENWLQILMHINTAATLLDPKVLGYIPRCFAESWTSPLPHEVFRLATPLFMVLAVAVIIIVARYRKIPRLLSLPDNSPVRAICILIFLSYSSISYISLKLLIPLVVSSNDTRVQVAPNVTYYDINEHLPYFMVAVCAELFFCLPICFLFLFAPLISRRVNLVRLRLKPIVDEFQACYKPEYRYFAGFYFLNRQLVYLACMTYTGTFPQNNSILATLNILVLITHGIIQPYSKKWLNMWDTVLLTDIVILSMSSPVKMSASETIDRQLYEYIIPYTLVIVPTLYLMVIILVTLAMKPKLGKSCCLNIKNFVFRRFGRNNGYQLASSPTSTVFDLSPNNEYREPLLEYEDSKIFDESSKRYGSL